MLRRIDEWKQLAGVVYVVRVERGLIKPLDTAA